MSNAPAFPTLSCRETCMVVKSSQSKHCPGFPLICDANLPRFPLTRESLILCDLDHCCVQNIGYNALLQSIEHHNVAAAATSSALCRRHDQLIEERQLRRSRRVLNNQTKSVLRNVKKNSTRSFNSLCFPNRCWQENKLEFSGNQLIRADCSAAAPVNSWKARAF